MPPTVRSLTDRPPWQPIENSSARSIAGAVAGSTMSSVVKRAGGGWFSTAGSAGWARKWSKWAFNEATSGAGTVAEPESAASSTLASHSSSISRAVGKPLAASASATPLAPSWRKSYPVDSAVRGRAHRGTCGSCPRRRRSRPASRRAGRAPHRARTAPVCRRRAVRRRRTGRRSGGTRAPGWS